jgi:Bacterial Ig-like domain
MRQDPYFTHSPKPKTCPRIRNNSYIFIKMRQFYRSLIAPTALKASVIAASAIMLLLPAATKASEKEVGPLSFTRETDTGISQTDGITKNNRPVVQGTGPAGYRVLVYGQSKGSGPIKSKVMLGTTIVPNDGKWKIQLPTLEDGEYVLVAEFYRTKPSAKTLTPTRK